jgi:hypothetical protein
MAVTNTLACYDTATITAVKSFIVQAPGTCSLKHFVAIINTTVVNTPVAYTVKLLRP